MFDTGYIHLATETLVRRRQPCQTRRLIPVISESSLIIKVGGKSKHILHFDACCNVTFRFIMVSVYMNVSDVESPTSDVTGTENIEDSRKFLCSQTLRIDATIAVSCKSTLVVLVNKL